MNESKLGDLAELRQLFGEPPSNWKDDLIRGRPREDGPGAISPNLANAITALRQAPEWEGVLRFNEFALQVTTEKPAPWASKSVVWTDQDDRLTTEWMQRQGIGVSLDTTGQAIQTVARERPYHPVRDYLDALEWDGVRRIDGWLTIYLNVPQTPYTCAVGARWLISAVARIYQPGCKADCAMILEGVQGLKKSTALKTLAGAEWFTDEIADLGSKDAAMQSHGVWIIEIGELDSMSRPEVGKVKAFMSRAVDRYRPPYGKNLVTAGRSCVFAGSVNLREYLRDETGARRFWPVACWDAPEIDIEALERNRDQLWAEARDRYREGSPWWLESPDLVRLAEAEQQARYEEDAWQDRIEEFLVGRSDVSISQILEMCLEKKPRDWTQIDRNRVGRCLRALGWVRYHGKDQSGSRQWRYAVKTPDNGNLKMGI